VPYKDNEKAKECWRRRNAKPERKAYMREFIKERRKDPEVRKRAYVSHKKWENKPANKVARASYAMERRKDGKVSDETKSKQLDRKKMLRVTDADRLKVREQRYRDRRRENAAGRPRPDACEICLNTTSRIVFEHCHKGGHFRGWVCRRCNWVLGIVKDDPQHLRQLAAYLERNRENTSPQLALAGI
jgi:phage-related minor tail protein